MNKLMIVVLFFVCNLGVFAQDHTDNNTTKNRFHGYVELKGEVEHGELTPGLEALVQYGGKGKVGAYCWAQTDKHYSQVYCGPTLAPKKWIEVGVAVGVESTKKPFQAGAFVWVGKGKFSNLFMIEKGDRWYRNLAEYRPVEKVGLGIVAERHKGVGPRLDYELGKGFSVSGEVRFNEHPSTVIGLRYSFH